MKPPVQYPYESARLAAGVEPFSFDIAGVLKGDAVDGQEFLGECKNYQGAGDQGTLYNEFVAKCYCAMKARPERCDNFMWITWAPFLVTSWATLRSADYVKSAVINHRDKAMNEPDKDAALLAIDMVAVNATAERLWMIVLSERQERALMMSSAHLGLIRKHEAKKKA